jgi:hypothetical protein
MRVILLKCQICDNFYGIKFVVVYKNVKFPTICQIYQETSQLSPTPRKARKKRIPPMLCLAHFVCYYFALLPHFGGKKSDDDGGGSDKQNVC